MTRLTDDSVHFSVTHVIHIFTHLKTKGYLMGKHTILGGKVHVYQRENSRFWQCATFLQGKNHRTSTKEESLASAKEFAEDWYLTLRGKHRAGELVTERTFKHAADEFTKEYEVITGGERSPKWVEGHKARIRLHLMPFLEKWGCHRSLRVRCKTTA